jgi:PAS domain S-box-containing protein
MGDNKEKTNPEVEPGGREPEGGAFFLASVVESLEDAVVGINSDEAVVVWNKAAERFYGYPAEAVIGRPLGALALPEGFGEALAGVRREGVVKIYETEKIDRAGRHTYFSVTLSPLKNDAGRVVGATAVACDITGRKKVEPALRDSGRKFRPVSDGTREQVGPPAADGILVEAARPSLEFAGGRREELDRQFLLELGEKIRFGDLKPGELLDEVTRMTSEHLGAARCLFVEIDEAEDRGTVRHEFCRGGIASVAGEYRISDYSRATLAEIKSGRVIVNHDAESDSRTAELFKTTYEPYGERSYVSIPLFTNGRWAAIFWVSDDRARRWSSQDVTFLESVGERAWLAAEKLRSEAELRQSEAHLRLAIGISHISTFEIDLLTDAVLTDETGREMYGFAKDEPLTFAKVQSHFHPDDREEVMRRVAAALDPAGTEEFEVEQRIIRADGETRWIRVRGRAFFSGAGESRRAVRCLGTYIDITRDKQVEQERERLLRREQDARRAAEEASRLKDEFLATVSHELRTPLTAILGWSHMLTTGAIDQDYTERALATIYRNAKSQAQLIEDILDVSRIVTGKLRLNVGPVAAAPLIRTVVESLRPSVEAKSIRLRTSLASEAGRICADPDRLQQVVWNLLSNAIKFTPERGEITVGLESGETEARIIVSDTGQGISPEFLPYVFDRFRQADGSTTRQHGGLGLGLSIVRHIVELHGGEIEVSSEGEGKGATFTVRLPLTGAARTDGEEGGGPTAGSKDSRAGDAGALTESGQLKGARVLLLDDEKDTLELLATALAQSGLEVRPQTSVRDALEVIREWRPDVVVSDIAMPGEDGYSFIRKLRALPPEEGGTIPAVALTAYAGIKEKTRVLSSGFQMYVPKPVELSELLATLASLI